MNDRRRNDEHDNELGGGSGRCFPDLSGCFILGFLLVLFWFGMLCVARDLMVRVGTLTFPVSEHEFLMVCYYGIAFVKLCNILFFLIPWVAMRLVLRKIRKSATAEEGQE